jgi:hypothetical protein
VAAPGAVGACGGCRCSREGVAALATRKRGFDTGATLSAKSYPQKRLNAQGRRLSRAGGGTRITSPVFERIGSETVKNLHAL